MKGKWERMMGEETMSEKEKAQRQYDPSTGIISEEEKQRNPLLSSSFPPLHELQGFFGGRNLEGCQ